jgi:hypothetical protein
MCIYQTENWKENYNKYKDVSLLGDDKKGFFFMFFLALKFYSLPTSDACIEWNRISSSEQK